MTQLKIPEKFQECKLIPLKNYSKVPTDKWGNDNEIAFKGNETGYGIDTGRSNLVVIDCDVKGDFDGVDAFLNMAEKEGGSLPETYSVKTPSGGMHFYYKASPTIDIRNSISSLAKGIDVRAKGGFIVGPESMVQDDNGEVSIYEAFDDAEIEELPDWLTKKLLNITPKKKSVENLEDKNPLHASEEIERKNALIWAFDKMDSAEEGERNKILNHTSFFMGAKRVDQTEAEELVAIAVRKGLTPEEANKTFIKAYTDGAKNEVMTFSAITKTYNVRMDKSFKDDPMDTEFYSHVSLAYNFWKRYNRELLFWNGDSSWYRYDKATGAWNSTKEDEVRALVKEFLEELVLTIRTSKVSKLPSTVYKAQERLWTKATIDATTSVARSDFMKNDEILFDKDHRLVNCKNGVYNLKTGELYDHDRNYYMTKYIPVNANLDAKDPYCDKIIEAISPDSRDFMQLMAGQSLTGEQPYNQTIFFLLGTGANGKSTFINLMLRTSGNYGRLQPPSVFIQENGKENYAMADFEDLRLAVVEELPEGKQLNAGALKRLAGTLRINSRKIYGSNKEFENQSTIFVSCNKLPMVNETDDGTWRRLVVINFPYSYKKNKALIKNPETDRLSDSSVLFAANRKASTAEAFLAWRLKGAKRWLQDSHCEDYLPQSSETILRSWNENNDLILAWFNDCLTPKVNNYILLQDAFKSFNRFLERRGNSTVSQRYFVSNFTDHKTFRDNQLLYLPKKRLNTYEHSPLVQDDGTLSTPGERGTIFLGVAFQ